VSLIRVIYFVFDTERKYKVICYTVFLLIFLLGLVVDDERDVVGHIFNYDTISIAKLVLLDVLVTNLVPLVLVFPESQYEQNERGI